MASELMTPGEVASHLGLSMQRIYQMVEAGQLPHIRLGQTRRTIRIPRTAWTAWLTEQQAQALASVKAKAPAEGHTNESRH